LKDYCFYIYLIEKVRSGETKVNNFCEVDDMKVNYDDLFKTSEKLKNHQQLDKNNGLYRQKSDEKSVDNSKVYEEIKQHRDL
jgi:hypothetical protein